MNLKYYLRGMGIGIILTAIVMGFALGGRKAALSDEEIITRARALGMVEGDSGVLNQSKTELAAGGESNASASFETLDKEGIQVSEEEHQEVPEAGTSVSEVASAQEEGKGTGTEAPQVPKETTQTAQTEETAQTAQASQAEAAIHDGSAKGAGATGNSTVVETMIPESTQTTQTVQTTDIVKGSETAGATESADQAETDVASAGDQNDEPVEQADAGATESSDTTIAQTQPAATTTQPVVNTTQAQNTQPVSEAASVKSKTVVIPGGKDSDGVAQILYNQGVVDDAASFNRYLVDTGMDRKIRSGNKTIPEGATYQQIAAIITSG